MTMFSGGMGLGGGYGGTGAQGGYGFNTTQTSAAAAPQSGNWWNNWGQQALGAAMGLYGAYGANQAAQDQRRAMNQAAQPQNTNAVSGWDFSGSPLGGMFDYFANEIPNIYNWTAQQYAGMNPNQGMRRGGGYIPGATDLTSGLVSDLANYARADDPMVQAGMNYLTNTVNGQSMNPYLDATFQHVQGGPLADFISQAMGAGFGGAGSGGISGGSGGGALMGPSQHQQFLENWSQGIMRDPSSSQWVKDRTDIANKRATEAYNAATGALNRGTNTRSSGLVNQHGVNAGRFGDALFAGANQAQLDYLDRALGGSGQAASMQNALTGANASITNANTGAAASNYASNNALRGQMAGLGLQAMLGQGGLMGDMAGLFSGDQRSAAGMIPGYHDIRMNDLLNAFQASMGLDQFNTQVAGQRAANQRAQSNALWNRQMQMAQMPWQNLGQAQNMLLNFAPFMGQQYTNQTSPGQYGVMPNIGMATLGGGLGGYADFMKLFGGGQGA